MKTEAGKILTMKSEPANALKSVLDSNPDIKIDYNNLYRTQEDQYKLFGKGRSASQMVTAGVPEEFARKYADPMNKQVTWTLQSKHMSGSAVDVVNPTPEVVKAMNQVGFFQPDDPWMRQNDAGHFEYKGVAQPIQGQGGYNEAQSPSYQKYLDKGILPTGIKEGTAKADQFESEALAYQENKKNNPTLSSGAKQAMDTKTITGTPAQKDAIANELYDAGVLNEQTGNKNYYLKDEKEKQGMLTAIKAKEAVDRVKAIYDKHVRAGDANEFLG